MSELADQRQTEALKASEIQTLDQAQAYIKGAIQEAQADSTYAGDNNLAETSIPGVSAAFEDWDPTSNLVDSAGIRLSNKDGTYTEAHQSEGVTFLTTIRLGRGGKREILRQASNSPYVAAVRDNPEQASAELVTFARDFGIALEARKANPAEYRSKSKLGRHLGSMMLRH